MRRALPLVMVAIAASACTSKAAQSTSAPPAPVSVSSTNSTSTPPSPATSPPATRSASPAPAQFHGVDASFISASEGWLVTTKGFWHTTDGGATWTKQAPLPFADSHVRFASEQVAYAWDDRGVGPRAEMTIDGGRTWTQLALTDVSAIETAAGYTWAFAGIPPYPTVWRAPVGTDDWTPLGPTPDRSATLDVHGTTAYVAGQQGAGPIRGSIEVLDTTTTPHTQPAIRRLPCKQLDDVQGNPLGVSTDGAVLLVCVGVDPQAHGHDPLAAYLSQDGGQSWASVTPPPQDPDDVTATRKAVFAWGADLFRFANGTWTKVLAGPLGSKGFRLVGFQDDTHGIAIDASGHVDITRDGGLTWTLAHP